MAADEQVRIMCALKLMGVLVALLAGVGSVFASWLSDLALLVALLLPVARVGFDYTVAMQLTLATRAASDSLAPFSGQALALTIACVVNALLALPAARLLWAAYRAADAAAGVREHRKGADSHAASAALARETAYASLQRALRVQLGLDACCLLAVLVLLMVELAAEGRLAGDVAGATDLHRLGWILPAWAVLAGVAALLFDRHLAAKLATVREEEAVRMLAATEDRFELDSDEDEDDSSLMDDPLRLMTDDNMGSGHPADLEWESLPASPSAAAHAPAAEDGSRFFADGGRHGDGDDDEDDDDDELDFV
eukprot:PLAT9164.5.p1 GENE.PLAT9164.5~~PLAT9164.5.p1  ORF type:complete len:336 (+),score=193.73 PLAT9164.5:80-1009(+)